jgi:flagellar hook-basal body complex protein FliE
MSNAISGIRILPAEIDAQRGGGASDKSEFLETLKSAMDQVQSAQGAAKTKVADLLNGNGMDVHSAMIAVEKADLSFQLMMQVRNKIVAAYQEVSRMQF